MANAIDTLVWLGAGELLKPELLESAAKVILVDAQQGCAKSLNSKFASQANVQVEHLVLASTQGEAEFHHYNLPEYSALSQASGLKQLFPGLRLAQTSKVTTTAIDDFISKLALDSAKTNVLVLDIIDQSLPLLQSLASSGLLSQFKHLQLPASNEPLYQGAATAKALTEFLAGHGYEVTQADSSDPDLPVLSFSLNSLWQELVTSEKLRVTAEQQLKAEKEHNTELKQLLETERQQAEKNSNKILQQLEEQKLELEQKVQQLQQQLANKVSEKETLQQQFSAAKVAAEKTQAELNSRMTGMDAELQQALKQLAAADQQLSSVNEQTKKQEQALAEFKNKLNNSNIEIARLTADNRELNTQLAVYRQWQDSQAQQFDELQQKVAANLSKSLTNSVKQLECFNGLRDLLSEGQMPLNYHGWPISADIALYLAKKVVTEKFDCIIEFGSGTSTVVFAKALQARQKITGQDNNCNIISFEHNKTYLQKTADDLKAHQVEELAELVYAPLIELQCDEQTYLYYSCDARLAELSAALQGSDAKVLVLVDGPPANTGPMARYPAIPLVLKHLAKHQLHIVMDDYVREDEKRAAGRWSKLFEERGIKHQKEMLNFEKVGFSWILNS